MAEKSSESIPGHTGKVQSRKWNDGGELMFPDILYQSIMLVWIQILAAYNDFQLPPHGPTFGLGHSLHTVKNSGS